jgi:hypothetical protein
MTLEMFAIARDAGLGVTYRGEVDALHVLGAVVVVDLPAGPVHGLDAEDLALAHLPDGGNLRVPPVVQRHRLLPRPLARVHAHDRPRRLDRRHDQRTWQKMECLTRMRCHRALYLQRTAAERKTNQIPRDFSKSVHY